MATCTSVFEAFSKMQPILDAFRGRYIAVLERLLQIYDRENLRVSTIYNKIPLGPTMPREALTALGLFNEIILEEANRQDLEVVDLRLICESEDSYSAVSLIEPSKEGGQRIVKEILQSYGL